MPKPRPSSARCWRWTPSIITQTPSELAQALAGQGRIARGNCLRAGDDPRDSEKARAMNDLALFLAPRRKTTWPRRSNCCKRQSSSPPTTRRAEKPRLDLCHLPGPPLPQRTKGRRTCPAGLRVIGMEKCPVPADACRCLPGSGGSGHAIEELRAVRPVESPRSGGGQAVGVDHADTTLSSAASPYVEKGCISFAGDAQTHSVRLGKIDSS